MDVVGAGSGHANFTGLSSHVLSFALPFFSFIVMAVEVVVVILPTEIVILGLLLLLCLLLPLLQ